jgi:hypothetical protein
MTKETTITLVKEYSKIDIDLATEILKNAGENNLSTYFLRSAALKLAKNILPDTESVINNATIGNKSQGQANPRKIKSNGYYRIGEIKK